MTKHKIRSHRKRWRVNPQILNQANYRLLARSMLFVTNCLLIGYFLLLPPSPILNASTAYQGIQEPIKINFTKPVLKDGFTPTIQPEALGTWQFEEPVLGTTLFLSAVFTPSTNFLPEQQYSLKFDDLSSLTSTFTNTSVIHFTTVSYPKIVAASVKPETELSDRCAPITLTLDQQIATAGAFTVTTSPEQPLDILLAEDGHSYSVLAVNCFAEGQHFVMTIEPSLEDTRDTSAYILPFSTAAAPVAQSNEPTTTTPKPTSKPKPQPPKPPVVKESMIKLAIANDHQDQSLTCEVAALKMALKYKGFGVSEAELMSRLGFSDPKARDGDMWGDPNVAFVGDPAGTQNSTGYGVYWGPIARVANQFASAQAFSDWSPSDLAREIAADHPVEIWGTIGRAKPDNWQTPDGQNITAWYGEHTRLVIGFSGTIDNPTRFIINDPSAGQLTWTTNQLNANWATFGNSGVVIK
jgi:uncharacterized protein YvpB